MNSDHEASEEHQVIRPDDVEKEADVETQTPQSDNHEPQNNTSELGTDHALAETNFRGIPQLIWLPNGDMPEGCDLVSFETIKVLFKDAYNFWIDYSKGLFYNQSDTNKIL